MELRLHIQDVPDSDSTENYILAVFGTLIMDLPKKNGMVDKDKHINFVKPLHAIEGFENIIDEIAKEGLVPIQKTEGGAEVRYSLNGLQLNLVEEKKYGQQFKTCTMKLPFISYRGKFPKNGTGTFTFDANKVEGLQDIIENLVIDSLKIYKKQWFILMLQSKKDLLINNIKYRYEQFTKKFADSYE